jgi:hypothetical protein
VEYAAKVADSRLQRHAVRLRGAFADVDGGGVERFADKWISAAQVAADLSHRFGV